MKLNGVVEQSVTNTHFPQSMNSILLNIVWATLKAFFLSFILTLLGIKYLIKLLQKYEAFQPIRAEGPEEHLKKARTPTMGGVVITAAFIISTIIFCNRGYPQIKIAIFLAILFSIIGLVDDILKVFCHNTNGFRGTKKLLITLTLTFSAMLYLGYAEPVYLTNGLRLPLIKIAIPFSSLLPLVYTLIICGSANASNMTDGLDGLLSVPTINIALTLLFICLSRFNGQNGYGGIILSDELLANIIIMLGSFMGSFAGFLVFNIHPAKIFMGDTGSLVAGAVLCYVAVLLKVEIPYAFMALLFVIEIFSSIIQVTYFKMTGGKRIFLMAPFHHHLEKLGWAETKVVHTLWTFNAICCLLGMFLIFFG